MISFDIKPIVVLRQVLQTVCLFLHVLSLHVLKKYVKIPIDLSRVVHRDYKRIEAASGDEPRNKLNKSNGGQI